MRPDYTGNGLVNLVASIVAARGGNALHPALRILRHDELRAARNVVLLVIDGLGDNYLRRRGAGGALARARRAAITGSPAGLPISAKRVAWRPRCRFAAAATCCRSPSAA
jgi:hypothetical protein